MTQDLYVNFNDKYQHHKNNNYLKTATLKFGQLMKLTTILRCLTLSGAVLFTSACITNEAQSNSTEIRKSALVNTNKPFVVSTWNVEHLAYPINEGCKPRTKQELKEMRSYVENLQADIVGLQEVASKRAIAQLFPENEWQIFLSSREDSESYECRKSGHKSTQQKVAFAVRKGITVENIASLAEFDMGMRGLRHALEITIDSPLGSLSILNVHLKSGCFVDDYSRGDSKSCQVFAKQAPILDRWVESKERQSKPYMILGDFNHRLSAPYNKLTRELTNNSDNSPSSLINTTSQLIGCHPYYPAPIDHIWLGKAPENLTPQVSIARFKDMQPKTMLSDHCAVSVQF